MFLDKEEDIIGYLTCEQYGQDDRILKSVESEPLSRAAACGKFAL